MSFPKASGIPIEQKIIVVTQYLESRQSLRTIAARYNVSHKILLHWVNMYKKGGAAQFFHSVLNKRKLPQRIEIQVRKIKEKNPFLSIRQARNTMLQKGIRLSIRAIWRIWDAYGLIFKGGDDPFSVYAGTDRRMEKIIAVTESFVRKNDFKHASQILNSLPRAPYHDVLAKVPDKYLNLRRKLERLWMIRGDIPWPQLMEGTRAIRKKYESMGNNLYSLIALYLEVAALEVIKDPVAKVSVLKLLIERTAGIRIRSIKFLVRRQEAATYVALGMISKAIGMIRECRVLANSLNASYYWEATGNLFTNVGDYKQAYRCFKRGSLVANIPGATEVFNQRMAHYGHAMAGRYKLGRNMLAKARALKDTGLFGSLYNFNRADLLYGEGHLHEARQDLLAALKHSTRVTRFHFIFAAAIGLASIAMAMNNRKEARLYLKKYIPLMEKHKLSYEMIILKFLLRERVRWTDDLLKMRTVYMFNLIERSAHSLGVGDYRKAFVYGKNHEILGLFHRRIVFFPEIVQRLLDKGKKTGLPKALLSFPIFNQQFPAYYIGFLGDLMIKKNDRIIKVRLTPQQSAFLIHLALRASEPHKYIYLQSLIENFWAKSKNPSSILSHLLVDIKKKLKMPSHLLEIVSRTGKSRLLNRGMFFSTDYDELNALFVEITALLQENEWEFAGREYRRAFALIRGKPFERMYDAWSEEMRGVILGQIRDRVQQYIDFSSRHKTKEDMQRTSRRIRSVLPSWIYPHEHVDS